eukprot:285982-Pyramimonas_sp.AAC.1
MQQFGKTDLTPHTALTTSSTSTTEGPSPPAPAFQAPPPRRTQARLALPSRLHRELHRRPQWHGGFGPFRHTPHA